MAINLRHTILSITHEDTMTKINSEMKNLYRDLRKQAHTNHCTINQSQTSTLIAKAQEIDSRAKTTEDKKSHHHLHIHRHHHNRSEGEAALKRLYDKHRDKFDASSQALLKSTVRHRASSNPGVSPLGTHRLSANDVFAPTPATNPMINSTVIPVSALRPPVATTTSTTIIPMPVSTPSAAPSSSATVAPMPVSTSSTVPLASTTVVPMPVSTPSAAPSSSVTVVPIPVSIASPAPSAPVVNSSVNSSNSSGVILDFHSKPTWAVHWFPQFENKTNDSTNNLYAKGGALDKLDAVSGRHARDYEYNNHRTTDRTKSWWGHCNNAAEIACLLQPVKRAVTMKGDNGQVVTFSTHDIQGLLAKVSSHLSDNVDFRGNRYNGRRGDDIKDPKPEVVIDTLKEWANDGMPFVMDVDPKEQVWNYPYDSVKITESMKAPAGFDTTLISSLGTVKYYTMNLSGTGYDHQKMNYYAYIVYGDNNQVVTSDWIKSNNKFANPDFLWRPHPKGDLMDRSTWTYKSGITVSNPEVDMGLIYDIYIQSIA